MKRYEAKIQYTLLEDGPVEVLSTAEKMVQYMRDAWDEMPLAECFWVVLLNRKNKPLGRHRISVGTATATLAHPREVYRAAVLASASAICCLHNHPSGDPLPSSADVQMTRLLRDAGKCLEITMLDHIVVGNVTDDPSGKGYYSFREAGMI
jgi:DNA repair protein RadC